MKASVNNVYLAIVAASLALLFVTVHAAPMAQVREVFQEAEDEQADNTLGAHPDGDMEMSGPWDAINTAALRKMLLQLDAEERLGRVSRSWPQPEPRGWGVRALDGRLARQWRADKRQVRFRQCYFNPISCFRK